MNSWKPDLSGVDIPGWVNFIAQDSDGSWWGYSVEPLQNHQGWYENELGENVRLTQAGKSTIQYVWKDSLIKL